MKQTALANNDFEQFRKPTRREKFLTEMSTVAPWADLVAPSRQRRGVPQTVDLVRRSVCLRGTERWHSAATKPSCSRDESNCLDC
jgi:hypothetical protein